MSSLKKYTFKVQVVTASGQKSPYTVLVYNSPANMEPALIPTVKNFRVSNVAPDGTFIGPNVDLVWEPVISPFVSSYQITFRNPANTQFFFVEGIPANSSSFVFSLSENMSGYASINGGAVGAYRQLTATIVTRTASGRLSEGVMI